MQLRPDERHEKVVHQLRGHHKHPDEGLAYDADRLTPIEDFDYNEVDRRLGLAEPEASAIRGWSLEKFVAATEALNEIIAYLARGNTLRSIGMRGLTLAWALRPELFLGEQSNADLARKHGITRQAFGRATRELFRMGHGRFFHNRIIASEADREIRRKLATEVHARTKAYRDGVRTRRAEKTKRTAKGKKG